jgi:Mlc titration factor MtfA (ptsG expression regulator)
MFRYPFFYKKLHLPEKEILKSNFNFYQKLTPRQQKLFDHRVLQFIEYHTFIGRKGLQVDIEMKLLIAGTAVMLSFGYDRYLYSLFQTILVYPEDYFSNITHQNHKGETNPKMGVIVFSWEDFKEGIVIEDDNLHLGLHEFAHALHFSFLKENTRDAETFKLNFRRILLHLESQEVRQRLVSSGYLREYAFENQYEFFAVMVEHFFESPHKFRENHPNLFHLMGNLLQMQQLMY